MLNLPHSTEVNRLLPKEKLIKKLSLSPLLKESLKDDIKRVTVSNELSPKSMNIVGGKDVSAVYVIKIQLKQKEVNYKLIEALGKQLRQRIVFVICYEDMGQLALYRGRLYSSDWMDYAALELDLSGADLDSIWNGIVMRLALDVQFSENCEMINDGEGVDKLLETQEKRKKLERELSALEKRMRGEKQPRRKLELAEKVKHIKNDLGRMV